MPMPSPTLERAASHGWVGQALDHDEDVRQFAAELYRTKRELEIARRQFDNVTDPLLIDHLIFRLGAAEKRLNYLLRVARSVGLVLEGVRWDLVKF